MVFTFILFTTIRTYIYAVFSCIPNETLTRSWNRDFLCPMPSCASERGNKIYLILYLCSKTKLRMPTEETITNDEVERWLGIELGYFWLSVPCWCRARSLHRMDILHKFISGWGQREQTEQIAHSFSYIPKMETSIWFRFSYTFQEPYWHIDYSR